MAKHESDLLAQMVPVMKNLALGFFCLKCNAAGRNDGVRANNAPGDEKWIVECECSLRIHRRGPQS